ncbi:hypothetical protein BEI02_18755 [Elizabethkingia sp. HvH-WGS333]|jgi:hypothetical protein|uniref:Uncharacterized protein n=2 Tax=Weeksellaceae TaxID=2762318 RepID=A0AAJ3TRM2_9FLAO|nr:hypothetical protein BBD34_18775 [Elizabethkingia ursingii]KUG14014.1 hypothetical protein AMC91_01825 [Elizabethkingia miricola]OIK44899.1 hypothetical protein BEI02_18755 [Elizabethkingia sp. HvH-WGS333]KUY29922.1 hypothetical protein ATB96_16605 [Elizabethkingia ursingii]OPB80547.1 hypothetical protein BAY32_16145 [Elizabethkingia ursingii]
MNMKNLDALKGKAIKVSREQMKKVEGGMRWTNDRGGCVQDRRSLTLLIESIRNMPVCCTIKCL